MNDKKIPEMSDFELEDVVSVLLGVPPEGEEVVIYEDEEESGGES